jgi:hypothetical protein
VAKLIAVRDSQMRTTVANVSIEVARGMVDRKEAEWTGSSRSIRLMRREAESNPKERLRYPRHGLSCMPDDKLMERQALAQNSGLDGAAVVAVQAWIGPVKLRVSREATADAR